MKIFVRYFLLALCGLSLVCNVAFAQNKPARSAMSTDRDSRRMVVVNGKITPLFWSEGITRVSDLEDYAEAGFNTVIVRLYWSPSPEGEFASEDLAPQQTFANAAAARGLYIVYALPEAPAGQSHQIAFSAKNSNYFDFWESWVHDAMEKLQETPNLIGWMLPDDPRGLPYTNNVDFQEWLHQHYESLPALNKEWKTGFNEFASITEEMVKQMSSAWRGVKPPQRDMTDQEFREYVDQATSRRPGDPEWAFHPAMLALGMYRWDAYRSLVDRWARIVHQNDPLHVVFSGQLHDYAELLALPDSVDVSIPAIWPGDAENDLATANPQAIDIARRAGRFSAIPVLPTSLPDSFPEGLSAMRMEAWSEAALMHGASGLALSSWQDFLQDNQLRSNASKAIQQISRKMNLPQWQQKPLATTAILLTPLADGHTIINRIEEESASKSTFMNGHPDVPSPSSKKRAQVVERGLYGFSDQLVEREPSDLVYALRWGSRFGGVDYLSPDDIGGEYSRQLGGVLKPYSTVLLPQAYWTPPPFLQELSQYVASGGTIVADLGIGAVGTNGHVNALPPELSELFGIIPHRMQTVAFNLHAAQDTGLLPSLRALSTTPEVAITAGDGPGGAAFAGPTVFTQLLPETKQLGLGFQLPLPLGDGTEDKFLLQRAWLSAAPRGAGWAIFAPFRLWTNWRPGYRGFNSFHHDLMGRGALLDTATNRAFLPSPSFESGTVQAFPEMVNYEQGIAFSNHTPPLNDPNQPLAGMQMAAAVVRDSDQFLWHNAVCLFFNEGDTRLLAPRNSSRNIADQIIGNLGKDDEKNHHQTQLFTWVKADETKFLEPLSLQIQPIEGTNSAAARVSHNDEKQLDLALWPGSNAVIPQGDDFRIPLEGGRVRIIISDHGKEGGYTVAPDSEHHLIITDWSKADSADAKPQRKEATVRANAEGQIILDISGASLQVQLSPQKA